MSNFARIQSGVVAELFTPPAGVSIASCFHSALLWVDVTAQPTVVPGWSYSGGVFTPPAALAAPVLTLAQRAWAAMATGLTLTSTGTPALSGAYAVDVTAQVITSQVTSILLNGTFADGTGSVAWPDTAGALHTFTIAQFKVFATAVAAYVAALFKAINGISTTLPSGSVTIS